MRVRTILLLTAVALSVRSHGAWTYDSSYDDFEEVTHVTATVSAVGEPYRIASFTFRCTDGGTDNSRNTDAYFMFGYLNRAGADDAPLRVKFGNDPPHNWEVRGVSEGRRGLFMSSARPQVEKLAYASSFKVRLAYHNEVGPTTISFSMEGAAEAIGHVLESDCAAVANNAPLDMEEYRRTMCERGRYAESWCIEHGFSPSATVDRGRGTHEE